MATVTLRFDDATKRELDEIVDEMGMTLSTFFMVYAKRVLRDRCIPFEINAAANPFWSERNQAQIDRAVKQVSEGKVVVKTMAELDKMADE